MLGNYFTQIYCLIIPVENSSIPFEYPVYHFGMPNNKTFYLNMTNKPIVHHARPSELIWHETFKNSNWA